jgi:hypothetical protein
VWGLVRCASYGFEVAVIADTWTFHETEAEIELESINPHRSYEQ